MHSAIGYARISEQDQSNNSLDNQVARITDYCNSNKLSLDKIFIENGKSAFTFDRPEWKKLESYIKAQKPKYLVVLHIDRFSRAKLIDALNKLHEIEVKLGVKVLTVMDPIDLNTQDFSVDLLRTLNLMFSNNERNRIQDRVKDGIYRSLSNGRYCNAAPFGYVNSRDENDKPLLRIDPEKAQVIRDVFRLFVEGMSDAEIRRTLKLHRYKLNGNSYIRKIIGTYTYAGLILVPAYKGNPERVVDAIHEPIVSKEIFYRAQSLIGNKPKKYHSEATTWLKGLVFCKCGGKFTAGNSKGRSKVYWYYVCGKCKHNHRAELLHGTFIEILKEISFNQDSIEYITERVKSELEARNKNRGGAFMRAKLELQKVRDKIKRTQEKYLLTDIDPDVFRSVLAELKSEEYRLENELSNQQNESDRINEKLAEYLPKLSSIAEIFELFPVHQRHVFIKTLFPSPIFWDGVYRTAVIHPIFSDKILILKEKRLIEIDQTLDKYPDLQEGTRERSSIEPLYEFLRLLVA